MSEKTKPLNIAYPELYHPQLARLIGPMVCLIRKLPPLENYQTLVSDDSSGRIPTLIMRDIITWRKSYTGQDRINTRCVIGGTIYLSPKIKDQRGQYFEQSPDIHGKTLVMSEYVTRDLELFNLVVQIRRKGIEADLATVSIEFDPDDPKDPFPYKVYYGEIGKTGSAVLLHNTNMAGVNKYCMIAIDKLQKTTQLPFNVCALAIQINRESALSILNYWLKLSQELNRSLMDVAFTTFRQGADFDKIPTNNSDPSDNMQEQFLNNPTRLAHPAVDYYAKDVVTARLDAHVVAQAVIDILAN